jgi:hypothetical protein
MEQCDDRVGHPEPGDESAESVAPDEHVDAETAGNVGNTIGVGEREMRSASRRQRTLHHEIALCEEQPCSGVVAPFGAICEPAFVQSELGEPRIVRVIDRDQRHRFGSPP